MKILFHRAKCIGCNYCVEVAPQRWQMSKRDGKSVLLGGNPKGNMIQVEVGETERESNIKAAELCPVKVIRITK
ncbi:MAG TPA: ferredoxin [Bacteroidetes bacterium]|nr:ferredoxin [Bacteroidota bacterium]